MRSPLRLQPTFCTTTLQVLLCLFALILLAGVQNANAQNFSGSIFTTFPDGTTVNGNIYPAKDQVYLDGGPQNTHAAGLPDGLYYFQVTDPSGSVLLSTDDIKCRIVNIVGGTFAGVPPDDGDNEGIAGAGTPSCYHADGGIPPGTPNLNNGSISVQLIPFNDTPNPAGEYKGWLTPVLNYNNCSNGGSPRTFGFCDSDSKTDNFKVKPPPANVTVCKFDDVNDTGIFDPTIDTLIAGWPITATGVAGDTGSGVLQSTGPNGCTTFRVLKFSNPDGTQTITFTEGLETGFVQTAPPNGTCTLTGAFDTQDDTCSVSGATPASGSPASGGVITVNVSPNDAVTVPYFGNFPNGVTLTVGKTATGGNNFKWTVSKVNNNSNSTVFSAGGGTSGAANYTVTVSHDAGTGWQVQGSIGITNVSGNDVNNVTVTDATTPAADLGCSVAAGSGITIPAHSTVSLNYTCTFSTNPGSGTNIATATVDSNSFSSPAVPFDFTSADTSVTITDSLTGNLGTVTINSDNSTSCAIAASGFNGVGGSLSCPTPVGSTATFSYSLTFTGDPAGTCTSHPNTATFTTNTNGTGTSSATVQDCQGADLTVSKTATASFNSSVSKSVDKTKVEQSGGNITFNYTVTVTESGWTVSGNITVTNPNDFESITTTVADALTDLGGNCVVNSGNNTVTLLSSKQAPGNSATLPYTCTFATRPTALSGTNMATATWDASAAHTVHNSATGTAGYTFATLTITDNVQSSAFPGGCNATLGTVSVTTTTPSASPGCGVTNLQSPSWGVFTYSITDSNSSPGTCTSYNNTAQITGGSASGQVTATVCNTNTGALTMGFWKNTNGQKIITSFCGGTSGTSLMAYLSGFNPFKDDTATTCAKEATYVAGVISAATCSSSTNTCNSMLRAQMLATALDVYFSDPTLGGNKIGAFNGLGSNQPALGGVAIDLSHICSMVDGSSGSTCTGVFEDARPEFGIASSCVGATVSTMLSYANFLSSLNGSPVATANTGASWYKQVKSKQVIAKDSFDNINNQIANIASTGVCTSTF